MTTPFSRTYENAKPVRGMTLGFADATDTE
jgi:hypothetical protein